MECYKCSYFVSHDIYSFLGFCKENRIITISASYCQKFRALSEEDLKKNMKEGKIIYCVKCKEQIHSIEEIEKHSFENIKILFSDDVASEESLAAD